jgi:hypothetical protein
MKNNPASTAHNTTARAGQAGPASRAARQDGPGSPASRTRNV